DLPAGREGDQDVPVRQNLGVAQHVAGGAAGRVVHHLGRLHAGRVELVVPQLVGVVVEEYERAVGGQVMTVVDAPGGDAREVLAGVLGDAAAQLPDEIARAGAHHIHVRLAVPDRVAVRSRVVVSRG